MPARRRESVAFTVVTVLCCSARPMRDHRPSGAPVPGPGHPARGCAGRPADRLLHLAGPLRARAEVAAGRWAAVGNVRRHRRGSPVQGIAGSSAASPTSRACRRGAGDRGGDEGLVPAPAADVAAARARRCPRRHRLRRDGRNRFRVHREHPLSRRCLQRHRGPRPGRRRGPDGTFVIRCLASPFAHPFFTAFTGIGVGLAIASPPRLRAFTRPARAGTARRARSFAWNSSTLGGPEASSSSTSRDGAGLPVLVAFATGRAAPRRRMLAAALYDAARRGLMPATDIPQVVDLAPVAAAGGYASRPAARGPNEQ